MRFWDWIKNNIVVYAFVIMTGLFSITCGNGNSDASISDAGLKDLCPTIPPEWGTYCSPPHDLQGYTCKWGGGISCCGKVIASSQIKCDCVRGFNRYECINWAEYCKLPCDMSIAKER